MASAGSDGDEVVLVLIDPSAFEDELVAREDLASISTLDIDSWNLDLILLSPAIKILAARSRLVEQSTYFRSLFCGNFSESGLTQVSIQWNFEGFLTFLQFIHGSQLYITSNDFLQILETSLYFGVETLLVECESWFHKMTYARGLQIPLNLVIEVWNFGLEHGVGFVPELCKGYLARNFAWITSWSSFPDIPYDLLHSCIEHPLLTLDSERQLCETLVNWISTNRTSWKGSSSNYHFDILKKVKICLLPLEFIAGLGKDLSQLGVEGIGTFLDQLKDCSSSILRAVEGDELDDLRIRVTEYTEKIVLSGCIHITTASILLALFPSDLEMTSKKRIMHAFTEADSGRMNNNVRLEKPIRLFTFSSVREVDISKCPKLHIVATIKCLALAFPSLSILRASHCSQFKMEDLYFLIQNIPKLTEADISVDVSPLLPAKVYIVSTNIEEYRVSNTSSYAMLGDKSLFSVARPTLENPIMSNISKLTLEGRRDITDTDLLKISALCGSLSYLNIKGCTVVTDMGISTLVSKCLKIQSLFLSYTSFGRNSIEVLCSDCLLIQKFTEVDDHKYSKTIAYRLHQLHIDGCKGVDRDSLSQLMRCSYMLKGLILRETAINDDALYNFSGSFLESLDVSETVVSLEALSLVIRRNPDIRCLKATGCTNLNQCVGENLVLTSYNDIRDHFFEVTRHCILEEIAFGWGFSSLSVEEPLHLNCLRGITIGLGASPGHHMLNALPKICPMLQSVILIFQVISDSILRSFGESLKNLRVLHLCCCLGDLTSFHFTSGMHLLRILRLERVTPWMTNEDLSVLTQNCPLVLEFSLTGCKLLDSASQKIIADGWPGLTFIHLEECGQITSSGVSSLFNCKAIEDLLLRHNGKGIGRKFIHDATSSLPLLRKLALDLCDACEGGFDSPLHAERCFLSAVMISRCKSQKCAFESLAVGSCRSVHKDTIVLEWNCKDARTSVVKERI
ncbi:BTB/POZ domain-containing protein FBL11-like isoform X1 [Zingiber officinale]|uniref:BTB/POZ domain-containing protein FBL11-like isoform X1 n=1 Tax=Zingiber officinale TaxID=94328 RepID=UPI001C4BEFB9|nr:BTB/POZ domain-containing protein FBL11-like isoform X1 [Zingiber officinale]